MKNLIETILENLKDLPITLKDVAFLFAGLVGAIVAGFKRNLNKLQFIQSIFTGVFVSWILGTILGNYLDVSNEVIYAICALAGHFSDEILRQTNIVVKSLAKFANLIIAKWLN